MKKILFLSFLVLFMLKLHAQTITLTFTAKDGANQNSIALDSVYVQNQTIGCDTTVYGASPILVIPAHLGIDEPRLSNGIELISTKPNPFNSVTIVEIHVPFIEYLWLLLTDNLGNQLAEYQGQHAAGTHKFKIQAGKPGLLLLNIISEKGIKSVKLINTCSTVGENCISKMESVTNDNKSSMVLNGSGFVFFHGNVLNYTAMVSGYENKANQDSPTGDTAYTFYLTQMGTIPVVATTVASDITQATAASGGNITSDGGSPVLLRGVCWDTNPNPTIANSYTADGNGSGIFISHLTGLAPNTHYFVRAYAINNVGTAFGEEQSFISLPFICGTSSLTINHKTGEVAPVDKTVTYGTVTNIPGEPAKCWITSNLGASHQATSVDDSTEASAGWYWQFNRKQGFKNDGATVIPSWTINWINETSDWLPTNDPCTLELGYGWRIPTNTEWTNVDANGNWINWNAPWDSGLKLHAAGWLDDFGFLNLRGSEGHYWSNVQYNATFGWKLGFNSNLSFVVTTSKSISISLRCLSD